MSYTSLLVLLLPEVMVTAGALVVLAMDLGSLRREANATRHVTLAWVSTAFCLAAVFCLIAFGRPVRMDSSMLVLDRLSLLMKLAMLALTVMTVWMTSGTHFTRHVGEYYAILLLATVGMMFLVSTEHLLMIFVALELLSLSLYILTAFDKSDVRAAEAGLKYFLFGGMAAAFTLFGLSLVYGLSGQLSLAGVAAHLGHGAASPLLLVALVMALVGFGFKVAAAPFHLWAPDTYQGAPLPTAAFVASGSKVASFFILAKVVMLGFASAAGDGGYGAFVAGWIPLVAVAAALSVILGNLAALAQSSVRRLLAYSAVAQAGYILVGLAGNSPAGMASVLYYAVTYALTIMGAFGVVGWVQAQTGRDDMAAFAGLSRRAPVISFCMLIFLLSLAGIPPLAGFFGKFYLFTAALEGSQGNLGLLWLVILAVAMSAVSLYYYLKILKQIYVVETPAIAGAGEVPPALPVIIGITAATVIVFGCLPGLLLDRLLPAVRAAGL